MELSRNIPATKVPRLFIVGQEVYCIETLHVVVVRVPITGRTRKIDGMDGSTCVIILQGVVLPGDAARCS